MKKSTDRVLNAELNSDDISEISLRPITIDDYIGQSGAKGNLKVFIQAALKRKETLDHVLLYGPPGLGKTTLAHVIANEMGGEIRVVSAPTIEKTGDLAAILSTLNAGDVLFIDEIHRLPHIVEELLYSAMEDYKINVIIGKDAQARSIQLDIPPFTLVGATTRAGDITAPLRDRFGIVLKLEYYNQEEIEAIIRRTSRVFDTQIEEIAVCELAKRSRGTPRIANRLFRRIRDFATIMSNGIITAKINNSALESLQVDSLGLDRVDLNYLNGIIDRFNGGPVGIESVASAIGEEVMTLEDVSEPYLLQIGFINRTARGRVVTQKAYEHLNKSTQMHF